MKVTNEKSELISLEIENKPNNHSNMDLADKDIIEYLVAKTGATEIEINNVLDLLADALRKMQKEEPIAFKEFMKNSFGAEFTFLDI